MRRLFGKENLLPSVLGFSDGILTALTLAAGLLTGANKPVTLSLAMRIAASALVSGVFVYFVAQYAALRRQLIRAERELNLTSRGQFAATHLGMAILREAILSAAVSSLAAFVGALLPLAVAALLPTYRWASILAAMAALAFLGAGLAHVVHGRTLRWSISLAAGGGALAIVGAYLKIVS